MNDSTIRLSRPTDIGNLVALDLKTYPYPLSMSSWQKLVKTSGQDDKPRVVVIEADRKSVGFATWIMKDDVCQIIRLGVLATYIIPPGEVNYNPDLPTVKNYRRLGYGSKLVGQCVLEAARNRKKKLQVYIPDIDCIPEDPDSVIEFLNANGFQPTGEVVYKFGIYYGDSVDAYVFERAI